MKLVGGSQKIILEVNTDFPTILILIPVHYIAINLQSSSLSFNFEPNFCDLYTACVKQNMCSAVWSPLHFLNSQHSANKSRKDAIPSVYSVI